MSTFEKRSVYHSDLVSHRAGLILKFTGKPLKSKWPAKDGSEKFFVGLEVDGDSTPYTLNIENESVKAQIEDVPVGQFYLVKATGKADSAYMIFEDANGNPVLREDVGTPAAPPTGHTGHGDHYTERAALAGKLAAVAIDSLGTRGLSFTSADVASVLCTYAIQLGKEGR